MSADLATSIPQMPSEPPAGTCDWGYCNTDATVWRWSDGHSWLPVCAHCENHDKPNASAPSNLCSCGWRWPE